jgi:hypothetical protein
MKLNEVVYAFVVSDFLNLVKKRAKTLFVLFENRFGATENQNLQKQNDTVF